MTVRQKFDRTVAYRMINEEKKTLTETARLLGVSKGSLSRAMKELRPAITTQVALEASHKIVSAHLDSVGQLGKINLHANNVLEETMRILRGVISKDEFDVRELKIKGELALKTMAEIREQLALQNDMMRTLYDVQAIAEFQKHVIDTVAQANTCVNCGEELYCQKCGVKVDLRGQLILRLKEARAVRAGVQFRS